MKLCSLKGMALLRQPIDGRTGAAVDSREQNHEPTPQKSPNAQQGSSDAAEGASGMMIRQMCPGAAGGPVGQLMPAVAEAATEKDGEPGRHRRSH